MSKIKAFTLVEILVTIAVASLLISFSFLAYSNYSKLFALSKLNMDQKMEMDQFHFAFENDFYETGEIFQNANALIFVNDLDTIRYIFKDQTIYRRSGQLDSFDLQLLNRKTEKFEKGNLIYNLELELLANMDSISLHFQKDYDVRTRINSESR
ncbi:MAG: type II secretion system protein [Cytophagales bacterium]